MRILYLKLRNREILKNDYSLENFALFCSIICFKYKIAPKMKVILKYLQILWFEKN